MLFHVLGHIETEHGVFVAEHRLRQRLAQLGFSDAGRTKEDEGAYRTLGVLESDSAAADRLGNSGHCLVLTDDALVENLLHVEQAVALLLGELHNGDPCPVGNDFGDDLRVHLAAFVLTALLPALFCLVQLCLHALLLVAQLGGTLKVLLVDSACLLVFKVLHLVLQILHVVG